MSDCRPKVILCGGSRGVGAAARERFAADGADIVILDRAAPDALAPDESYRHLLVDAAHPESVEEAVAHAVELLGGVDVLVNHIGNVHVGALHLTTNDEWDRLMTINVKSMFVAIRTVLPTMMAQSRGNIVNTSSISGFTATPLEGVYSVTKGAVQQLTRAVAIEYRDHGIRCNAVCPGFIDTEHGRDELSALRAHDQFVSDQDLAAAQGRMCKPTEVAEAIAFLAGSRSSFINGECLVVDNGSTVLT